MRCLVFSVTSVTEPSLDIFPSVTVPIENDNFPTVFAQAINRPIAKVSGQLRHTDVRDDDYGPHFAVSPVHQFTQLLNLRISSVGKGDFVDDK